MSRNSQLPLFGEAPPSPKTALQQHQSTEPKQILATPAAKVAAQSKIKPVPSTSTSISKPAPYGYCRVCGLQIAIPGLDASLCSNPARSCGSSGWVTDPQWLASQPTAKGGQA